MAVYSDDFSGTLANWTQDVGTWSIVSGTLRSNTGGYHKIRYTSPMDGQAHWSQATISSNNTGVGPGVFARGTVGSANTFYGYVFFESDSSYMVEITAGAETILATGGGYTFSAVVARITADGSALTGTRGGSADISTTDSSLTGLGVGVMAYNGLNSSNEYADNWSAEDIGGGGGPTTRVRDMITSDGIVAFRR
jgi:hypothetical protein